MKIFNLSFMIVTLLSVYSIMAEEVTCTSYFEKTYLDRKPTTGDVAQGAAAGGVISTMSAMHPGAALGASSMSGTSTTHQNDYKQRQKMYRVVDEAYSGDGENLREFIVDIQTAREDVVDAQKIIDQLIKEDAIFRICTKTDFHKYDNTVERYANQE